MLSEKREDLTHLFLDPRKVFQQEEKLVPIVTFKYLKNIRDHVQISFLILNEFKRINWICSFLIFQGNRS